MSAFDRSAATLAADHRWAKRAAIRGHRRAEEPRQVAQRPARLASLEAPPLLRPEHSPRNEQHPPMADPALVLFCGGGDDGSALASALASLTRTPGLAAFVVYLAQDGNDVGLVSSLASEAVRAGGVLAAPVSRGALHLQRPRAPADGSDESQHGALAAAIRRWALDTVLGEHQRSHALLVDDRMAFAADFLQLFQATAWLLDMDEEGLWCVSAWNDYGFEDWEWSEAGLMRSDYFSGVAWMTTAKVWGELGPTFPGSNWADWMRASPLRAGRQCIVPHLNRVQLVGPAASENPLDRPTSDMAFFGYLVQSCGVVPGPVQTSYTSSTISDDDNQVRSAPFSSLISQRTPPGGSMKVTKKPRASSNLGASPTWRICFRRLTAHGWSVSAAWQWRTTCRGRRTQGRSRRR